MFIVVEKFQRWLGWSDRLVCYFGEISTPAFGFLTSKKCSGGFWSRQPRLMSEGRSGRRAAMLFRKGVKEKQKADVLQAGGPPRPTQRTDYLSPSRPDVSFLTLKVVDHTEAFGAFILGFFTKEATKHKVGLDFVFRGSGSSLFHTWKSRSHVVDLVFSIMEATKELHRNHFVPSSSPTSRLVVVTSVQLSSSSRNSSSSPTSCRHRLRPSSSATCRCHRWCHVVVT